jgi:hypothetical protein
MAVLIRERTAAHTTAEDAETLALFRRDAAGYEQIQ